MSVLGLVIVTYASWGNQEFAIAPRKMETKNMDAGGRVWSAGYAFWLGIVVASLPGLVGGKWVWDSFRATLEYETSFPATIPRRRRG